MAAFYANPQYGLVPGAPQGLNWWDANRFMMSGLQPPPVALPPPPPPLAATVTPQDVAASNAFVPPRTDTGGAQPGGGGPGSGPGGLGGASGGGQDTTTSGYQGVYAQAPDEMNSQFGQAGGLIGMGIGGLAGIPGPGTALGALGGALDAARYNGVNAQYGIPGTVNPWGSALASVLSGIGIPFTDMNLARAFNVPTAQQRQNAILDLYGQPVSRESMGYGALAANQPVGPAVVGAPPSASYPPGFLDWSAAQQPAAAPVDKSTAAFTEADLAGWADAMAGKGGTAADMGQSTGYGGDKGDVGAGQQGGSGDTSRDGSDGGYKYRGGLIGAPPGRYQQGGRVPAVNPNDPPALTIGRDPAPPVRAPAMVTVPIPMWERMLLSLWGPRDQYGGVPSERRVPADNSAAPPGGYAAGGLIPQAPGDNITPAQFGALRAINPPGPDDQIGALQTGEGVIRKDAMQRYPGLLAAINAGTLDPGRVKGLLTPVSVKPRRVR